MAKNHQADFLHDRRDVTGMMGTEIGFGSHHHPAGRLSSKASGDISARFLLVEYHSSQISLEITDTKIRN